MPGIVGIIRKRPYDGIERDLQSMIEVLTHHDNLVHGYLIDQAMGIWIGWIDLRGSFSDPMPVRSRDGSALLMFQGEHFPPKEDVAQFRRAGMLNATGDNGGGLMDLYRGNTISFLRELNGWFVGVLILPETRTITLFNDRFGVGRLYYVETEDEFLFASEAKALLRIRPALKKINATALAEQLRYNCVVGNRSLFSNVSLLPAGSAWTFGHDPGVAKGKYFQFDEWENSEPLAEEEFFQQWSDVVGDVFGVYAVGAQHVALSLTAGLDTRLIMAALGEHCAAHPAYTFGGAWGELYDVSTARRLARVWNQDFSVIKIDQKFFAGFSEYARQAVYLSDGNYEACGAHDVYFNQEAAKIAPIRLTGKFGSEIIRIRRLMPSLSYDRGVLLPDIQKLVSEMPSYYQTNAAGHPLTRVMTEEVAWHEYSRMAVEQTYLRMRTPYMDNRLVQLMYRAPPHSREKGDLQEDYVKKFAPVFAQVPTNLGRFTSNNSFVAKLAYLAYWALFKLEYIYLFATPHWLTRLDCMLEGWHPEHVLSGRQKWEGYRLWLRTHFADYLRDTLLKPGSSYGNYFDYQAISHMVNQHTAGTHNHLSPINRALSLQLVYETMLEA